MARIRVFLKIPSDDAYELKAQALNNDPRLKAAGISALKFESDKKYIADGELSPDLPPSTAPEPDPLESGSDSAMGGKLRVVLRLLSEDAYELKAQALNNDPRLKAAGISALKFETDKKYIVDGEFSPELPSPTTPETVSVESEVDATMGGRLRVVLRLLNEDAYELKAQALNNDPRLKEAGISALKFESDKKYIVDGEFSPEPPSQEAAPAPAEGKSQHIEKVRVYLRVPNEIAYSLISSFLNGDPRLKEAGIAEVSLVKGGGVAAAPEPVRTPPKKRAPRRAWGWALVLGLIILLAAGAVFAAPMFVAPPSPTAVILPTHTSTSTEEPIPITGPFTSTAVPITKTRTTVPTMTRTFTPEPVAICPVPEQGTILQQLNCRWGPGGVYIYADGVYAGETVQIIGRQETAFGNWVNVRTPREVECWISAEPEYIEPLEGEISCVEGDYYPDKVRFPVYSEFPDRFPPPSDASANRQGDQVSIYWTGIYLAPGDRPDEGIAPYAPIYLVETWTCQAGKIVLTPMGVYRDPAETDTFFAGVPPFTDEAGCSEPSYARVWLAHKDGYVGPVTVTW